MVTVSLTCTWATFWSQASLAVRRILVLTTNCGISHSFRIENLPLSKPMSNNANASFDFKSEKVIVRCTYLGFN